MSDDSVYDASPGGGQGDGTTTGTTGTPPGGQIDSLDDREYPTNDEAQEEALEKYQPNPELPQMMVEHSEADGPFENIVEEPRENTLSGTPQRAQIPYVPNPDMPISPETEQAAAEAVASADQVAQFEANGSDQPSQEVS